MSNKNINQLFEALSPKNEQKEKMFHNILVQSQNKNKRHRGFTAVKRLRPAVLSAVLMVCLTTTAFAAVYMGLDETFLKFLNPVNNEQAQYLSNGAYVIDKQVENEDGSLTIKQVIGDSNLSYILMDFTAPEGTVLHAARYRFGETMISSALGGYSIGYNVLDDGNPNDNKISLVMNIQTKKSIAGQTLHFEFKNLQAADPGPGGLFNETVVPGSWETAFKLDFKEYSNLYQIDQNITMFGYSAELKTISVSPISISLKIESSSSREIFEAAGSLKEIGENEYLDNFPITINYKDGTSETTKIFTGSTSANHLTDQILTIKTFENVINDKEIASIVFFDKEFPIKN
ncbi:hypothetical protein AN963_10260 [Brevibacillus choshinensis]|uniref:DUF4179 domain-containing protein n=1 Tax=Brevibacillus choshinensis TaxID=54911 RepID=A0ABR5NEP6_BRECH|nr:DUF4179 domain-containing protein [Brevibacillus choshinensis]KQL50027.1 hypothetical protein AN963_10260 [Brevibacillus choshinensis]